MTRVAERTENKKSGFLGLLRESLSGSKVDHTQGNLNRVVLLLAIPMMLELALESVFSVVDIFWVSRLGADALAAVGLTESLLTLVFAISSGLGTAATALVARHIGEGDKDRAALDAVQAIGVGIAVSCLIGVPALIFAPKLLALVGGKPEVVHIGTNYARVALGTSGIVILLSLNNAIFRGAGNAAIAMRLLWSANLVNLALDPLLVFGFGPFPKLGVTGPAVATLIGRGGAVLYQFFLLGKGTNQFRIAGHNIRLHGAEMWSFIRVSSAGMLQFLLEQGSWLGLVRIASVFGPTAIAGYTIGYRIISFVLLPSIGLSNAAATLAGQNIGAGHPDRARSSVWRTSFWNVAFLGSLSLLIILFAHPLVALFAKDPQVASVSVLCLRFFSLGNLLFAFTAVFMQAFNGAGDTFTPTYINLIGFWLVELPLAWLLATHTHLKVEGVFGAVLAAQIIVFLLSGALFLRGKWLNAKV